MPTDLTQDCSLTDAAYLQLKHGAGLGYTDYLATGTPSQQAGWSKIYDQVELTDAQRALLGGFEREIKVLVVSGIWCGDCVRQGPMLEKIAKASNGKVDLAWLDRDEHMDLQEKVKVCAGNRVPIVIFAAEDFELVGYEGDKLLSRYRAMAKSALGPNCPLPGAPVPQDELDAELADWVDAFERVHLLLRLSGRLRSKHGD
ncbi:MAG: thioredoxin family protein [Phycisphaerales bacterium JB063]